MGKPKLKQHHINREWCKGCGICVELCPKKVLELDETDKVIAARPQDCICCKLCELRCPAGGGERSLAGGRSSAPVAGTPVGAEFSLPVAIPVCQPTGDHGPGLEYRLPSD